MRIRKLVAHLFMSVDGVVEAPDRVLRAELYQDLDAINDETIGGQDAVLLGRKTYEEWSAFWPGADIEPFASFINATPKFVVSKSLTRLDWWPATLINADVQRDIDALKDSPGQSIGVHGSISLVSFLINAGLLDELRLVMCPALSGSGRRLLSRDGAPIQLDLCSSRTTPGGLAYLVFHPRG
ncbi:MAG: dihydrofolate reductase family protein [Parvularculaceae bacterium]